MGKIERDGVTYVYADGTGGLQSIPDILQNFGTLRVVINPPPGGDVGGQSLISGLYSDHCIWEININKDRFNFIRNKVSVASHPLPRGTGKTVYCFARWGPESIDVTVRENEHGPLPETGKSSETPTPHTVVPDDLIRWARDQNHLPSTSFGSAEDFYVEFVNIIDQMQKAIEDSGSQRIFWDTKKGSGTRTPKAEPEVSAAIHLFLKDAAVRKDFQIVPQAGAAGGSLDFQINKVVEGGKLAVIAMESKKAHAGDIEHGLSKQLPAYMHSVSAEFGIYLVLWFKGMDFDRPVQGDFNELRLKLEREKQLCPTNVRMMHLDLSVPPPPSKR